MTTPQLPEQRRTDSENKARTARLFVLDIAVGRILSLNPDGSDKQVIVTDCPKPDGIAVDKQMGHIYWTNMGEFKQDDGSIERVELDGKNRTTIVPKGETFTPKQLALDRKNRKLYWSDREGMRVMRCNLDGSQIQTLVDTSKGDPRPGPDEKKWCVGIAADADRGRMYWTQKGPDNAGVGRIFRANIEVPKGETPANRSGIEVLYDGLPEPIDLELDLKNRLIYWTDRGDPPRGNTVNRAPMDSEAKKRPEPDIIFTHLMEGIGIAVDFGGDRMFLTDLTGSIYSAKLDGSEKKLVVFAQGNLTGIAYAEVPNNRK
jgi:hypothetical protein